MRRLLVVRTIPAVGRVLAVRSGAPVRGLAVVRTIPAVGRVLAVRSGAPVRGLLVVRAVFQMRATAVMGIIFTM